MIKRDINYDLIIKDLVDWYIHKEKALDWIERELKIQIDMAINERREDKDANKND